MKAAHLEDLTLKVPFLGKAAFLFSLSLNNTDF